MTHYAARRAPPKIRVLIVDDHPLFREGLHMALDGHEDILVIGECADGSQALQTAFEQQPDVILLDINLPGMNGLQVTSTLKADQDHIIVILLTAYDDLQQLLSAMRAGASAYCPKDITPEDLVGIIRDTMRGMYVVAQKRMTRPELLHWIGEQLETAGGYALDPKDIYVPLSPREMEILQCVTNGLSNKEIALRLSISQQTVKNHMTSILKKMNVQDRTQAAVNALRHGWVRFDG